MRTVIFDLDGTLADTSADLIEAANNRFRALGYGDLLDPVADAATAFQGGRAMLRLGFGRVEAVANEVLVEREYLPFLDAYQGCLSKNTTFYSGAIEAVKELISMGYKVGICTNKPATLAEQLMQDLGARDLFGSLVGADTLPVRKPDPAPYLAAVDRAGGSLKKSVLVGDTITDRKTATAAGVPVILVTFGPDGDNVKNLEPDALLPDYSQLIERVQHLIG